MLIVLAKLMGKRIPTSTPVVTASSQQIFTKPAGGSTQIDKIKGAFLLGQGKVQNGIHIGQLDGGTIQEETMVESTRSSFSQSFIRIASSSCLFKFLTRCASSGSGTLFGSGLELTFDVLQLIFQSDELMHELGRGSQMISWIVLVLFDPRNFKNPPFFLF